MANDRARTQRSLHAARLGALLTAVVAELSAGTVSTSHAVLQVTVASGQVYAGMGLNGLAVVDLAQRQVVHEYPDLPTLTTLVLDDHHVLLGGRDSVLRLAETGDAAIRPKVMMEWPVEGIPSGLAMQGNLLVVAGGGAGVSVWEWLEREKPPHLVGRYPFTDYSKEVLFSGPGAVLVADGFDTGLLALDVAEPIRPRSTSTSTVRGFCDSIALHEDIIAASSRRSGIMTFELHRGGSPRMLGLIPVASANSQVNCVDFFGGHLFSCEGPSGIRVLTRDAKGKWNETALVDTPGNALDVDLATPVKGAPDARTEEYDLVVADGGAGLTFLQLKIPIREGDTRPADTISPDSP